MSRFALRAVIAASTLAALASLSGCTSSSDKPSSSAPSANGPTTSSQSTPNAGPNAAPTVAGSNEADSGVAAVAASEAQAVTDIETPPGVADDGFVGAASDVTTDSCAKDGASWKASGTVKNPTGKTAKYRIYVAFNRKDSTDTRALVQTNVEVPKGGSQAWKVSANVDGSDLSCILRVERTS